MTERLLAVLGVAVFIAFVAAGTVSRTHVQKRAAAAGSPSRAAAAISDGEVLVGRPHDGPQMERALVAWSRHVRRHERAGAGGGRTPARRL